MNIPDQPESHGGNLTPDAAKKLAESYQAAVMHTLMKMLQEGKTPTFLDITKPSDTINPPSSHETEERNRLN